MKACILAVGDEIVGGLTTDTNSGFVAQLLRGAGVEVVGFLAVADDGEAIQRTLRRALEDADVVVTTGGLGPTADDLTTACIAAYAAVPLDLHEPSMRAIEERFRVLGVPMSENNRKQALLPRGSVPIPNLEGTAPGFALAIPFDGREKIVVSLPGVPREMRPMAERSVLPLIAERSGRGVIGSRVFSTVGLSESKLDELLADALTPDEGRLSFRAAFPRLQARVTVTAPTADLLESRLDSLQARIAARLGDHLYAIGDEGLEETVGRLLREHSFSLAVAESCTGGLIAHRLTDVPGCSDYFLMGVVAYANEAKERLLGVSRLTLEKEGAVSEATVREMAHGVRLAAGATLGLATSGIAGPGGGSVDKPVGTVCIGLAWNGGDWTRRYQLGARSRSWVKEMTAQIALDRVRRHLVSAGGVGYGGGVDHGGRAGPDDARHPARDGIGAGGAD